ncbi:sex peptide receptor-like [Mercenaria mercenaria]|uniref:sex peptide receptor-like n=1 Tax=Mercenaria mercenaria TaxID=6596 RepID=UPI00234F6AD0|nr:sex peptide receptor-like [Mercenaria mercenaria]
MATSFRRLVPPEIQCSNIQLHRTGVGSSHGCIQHTGFNSSTEKAHEVAYKRHTGCYNFFKLVSFSWCVPLRMLYFILPTIFHTASIWLTVVLAAQRYIRICYSQLAVKWCTIANVIRATVIVYIVAFLSHLTTFIDFYVVQVTVQNYSNPNETFKGCSFHEPQWAMNNKVMYKNTYFWFRITCIHLVPCIALIILNGLLISAMQKAKRIRIKLLKAERESRKLMERNSSTLMLVAVVGIFLLVEFPLGILMFLYVIDNTIDLRLFPAHVYHITAMLSNFFILLSYPIDLVVYCLMSGQFRETFKGLFKSG